MLIQWESSGLTVNDEGETNIDVYLCTGWGDMSCYKNRKCHYQLEWDDSHKEGYATFYYTIGNIYVCLEDTKFYSVYGYSGEFTITDDRRLSDAWRLPQYSNFSSNALESKSDVHSRHEPRHLGRLLKGGWRKGRKSSDMRMVVLELRGPIACSSADLAICSAKSLQCSHELPHICSPAHSRDG